MTRVLKFHLRSSHPDWVVAYQQSTDARRLFNTVNAVARESFKHRKDPSEPIEISESLGLDNFTVSTPSLGSTYAYEQIRKVIATKQNIQLPQKVAQRVGVAVANAWKSYYALRKNGHNTAKPPKFKQVYGTVEYTKQALSSKALKKNRVAPTGWNKGFELPDMVSSHQVQSARLIHSHDKVFILEVTYNEEVGKLPIRTENGLSAGIDLGVDSLATMAFSDTSIRPFRVDGRRIKSINQYYNKRGARYRSRLDREGKDLARKMDVEKVTIPSRKLKSLWAKRSRIIDHYLHSASKAVVRAAIDAGVSTVVIGWNKDFKKGSNMGKRNNQNFVNIPHARFRDMLTYKLNDAGIKVIIQEESYTSKASFIDNDAIPVYDKENNVKHSFSGRRITRGQYRTGSKSIIHADVNGAYNIIRKSNQPMRLSNGIVVMPQRLKF